MVIPLFFVFALTMSTSIAFAQKNHEPDLALFSLQRSRVLQAQIYGYPLLGMYARMTQEVLDPSTRKAPFGVFYHYRDLSTPTDSPFRAPNNDTLYSTAWLDLRSGPVVLDVPETDGRYYTAQILDLTSETIGNLGQRLHGTGPGRFIFVDAKWHGELPSNVKAVVKSATPYVAVLLRILVDGESDLPIVNALQNQFVFSHLNRSTVPQSAPPIFPLTNARERFTALDTILRNLPVRPGEQSIMTEFAGIGIGPISTILVQKPSDDTLEISEKDSRQVISSAGIVSGQFINGWRVVRDGMGSYGYDYLQRASVWDGGPLANVVEESFYPSALMDQHGNMLNGNNNYRLHFDRHQLPPANAFWSLTMYRMNDGNLVANPINRYSIGDRTKGIAYDDKGGLTITISKNDPDNGNWLPAPDGPFYMVLRIYGTKQSVISGDWIPPTIYLLR